MKFLLNHRSACCLVSLLVVYPLWLTRASFGTGEQTLDTNICALVAHPKDFNKRTVRVRAQVVSSVEGTALFADSCRSQGVALWVAKDVRENPDQKALDDAIFRQGYVGTVGKKITAVFTGQFLWHPREHPRRVLMVQTVEDLKVEVTEREASP